MTKHLTGSFDVATDMDDVLVHVSDKWVRRILEDESIMSQIPPECGIIARNSHPMNRSDFAITSQFGPESKNFSPEINKKMLDCYFMDPNFYDDLQPCEYYRMLRAHIPHKALKSVTVVTSCIETSYPVTASKLRFLNRVFEPFRGHSKLKFLFTEKGETKAEAMNSSAVQYHSFADDHLDNILDVVNNTNSLNREFFIPRYRHNINIPDLEKIMFAKKVKFFWFDNGLVLNETRISDPHTSPTLSNGVPLKWHN